MTINKEKRLNISVQWHLVATCSSKICQDKIQTLWPLVRKRIIPTEQPPLVGEF
jgi:hypothetical protein